MVALVKNENLGFVFEPAEGSGVDDAVAIAAKGAAGLARRLGMQSATAAFRIACIWGTGNVGFHCLHRASAVDLKFLQVSRKLQ